MFLRMPVEILFMIFQQNDIFTLQKMNVVDPRFQDAVEHLKKKHQRTPFPSNKRRQLAAAIRDNNNVALNAILGRGWYDLAYSPIFSGISDVNILNRAIKLGHMDSVRLLIKHGAVIQPANLEQALSSGKAHILAYLLDRWDMVDRKQFNYLRILHVACERMFSGEQMRALLDSTRVREGLEFRDMYDRTCLFKAIKLPINVLQLLLEAGANVQAKDYRGQTALHVIMTQVASLASRALLVPLLQAHGLDVKAQDQEGNTALHIEMRRYDRQCYLVVQALMQAGADPLLPNWKGETAMRLAERRGPEFPEFVKVMQDPLYDIGTDI